MFPFLKNLVVILKSSRQNIAVSVLKNYSESQTLFDVTLKLSLLKLAPLVCGGTHGKGKCSTKVKYRPKWECLGCCGGTLEEVVMMTALTQCRCSKAWQVGQLPRTHYFSLETNLVMCKVPYLKDWSIVNREIFQVSHGDPMCPSQGYTGRTVKKVTRLIAKISYRNSKQSWCS